MFDIGFSELLLIGIVALIVIGPERLPKVARTAGLLFGRMQRYISDVKADINRELQMEELNKLQNEIRQQVSATEQAVAQEARQTEEQLKSAANEAAAPVREIIEAGEAKSPEQPTAAETAPQIELPLEPPASRPAPEKHA
jgi:sec-independent protein translocase protein TatB